MTTRYLTITGPGTAPANMCRNWHPLLASAGLLDILAAYNGFDMNIASAEASPPIAIPGVLNMGVTAAEAQLTSGFMGNAALARELAPLYTPLLEQRTLQRRQVLEAGNVQLPLMVHIAGYSGGHSEGVERPMLELSRQHIGRETVLGLHILPAESYLRARVQHRREHIYELRDAKLLDGSILHDSRSPASEANTVTDADYRLLHLLTSALVAPLQFSNQHGLSDVVTSLSHYSAIFGAASHVSPITGGQDIRYFNGIGKHLGWSSRTRGVRASYVIEQSLAGIKQVLTNHSCLLIDETIPSNVPIIIWVGLPLDSGRARDKALWQEVMSTIRHACATLYPNAYIMFTSLNAKSPPHRGNASATWASFHVLFPILSRIPKPIAMIGAVSAEKSPNGKVESVHASVGGAV